MEMLQSVSRSGGDGAEGDACVFWLGLDDTIVMQETGLMEIRLKDWGMQERFRTYINERVSSSPYSRRVELSC